MGYAMDWAGQLAPLSIHSGFVPVPGIGSVRSNDDGPYIVDWLIREIIRIQLLSVHIDKKQNRITSRLPCSFINLSVAHAFHVPLIITMCNNQNGFPYSGQLTESTRSVGPTIPSNTSHSSSSSIYLCSSYQAPCLRGPTSHHTRQPAAQRSRWRQVRIRGMEE